MIYFDYASTTPLNEEVLISYSKLLGLAFGNSSASHRLGLQAEKYLDASRKSIGELLAINPQQVIFTSGATESTNLVIKGLAARYKSGHIITSSIEHPSVLAALAYLQTRGYEVTYLDVNEEGLIDLAQLKQAITSKTFLVSIQHVNNEIGTIQDISAISKICKENKVLFHCDIVQSIGKLEVDFSLFDYASISAHKIFGLKGVGMLFKGDKGPLIPLLHGGNQEFGYRSGTVNWPGAVSLAKTLRIALEDKENHLHKVKLIHQFLYENLKEIEEVILNSPVNGSPYILNFSLKTIPGEVMMNALEALDIIVSTTSACGSKKKSKSHVVFALSKDDIRSLNAIRISLSHLNTLEEAKIFIVELKKIIKKMK